MDLDCALVKLLDMLEPLEVSCEGGHGLTTEVTFYDLAEGCGFCTGRDGLTPIVFQHEEAVMDYVPYNDGPASMAKLRENAKHLKATYWFTCHQTEGSIVLRFARVDSNHPTGVEWEVPIQVGDNSIPVQVLDDGTLEFVCLADKVIRTQSRPQR